MNQRTMPLVWGTCGNPPSWCDLGVLNLDHSLFDDMEGVYVIWYWNQYNNRVTVKVGQGKIRERLQEHRRNYSQLYAAATLYVTWAEVFWSSDRDGVENYLGNLLLPAGLYPDVDPIIVNLPW